MEDLFIKPDSVIDHLILRSAAENAEIDHLRQILNQGHYFESGLPAGHVLWQRIYRICTESDCPELVAVFAGVVRDNASKSATTTSSGTPPIGKIQLGHAPP